MLLYKALCLCSLAFSSALAAPVPDFDLSSVTAAHDSAAADSVLTVAEYVTSAESK
jgi:hypothetical protein